MTIPNELLRSTPRSVALTGGGKAVVCLAALFAFVALIGGAWIYVIAGQSSARHVRRAADAITAQGEILTAKKRDGRNSRWVMTYRFTADSRQRTGTVSNRKPMVVGSRVTIGYLPNDPGDNWVEGHEPGGPPAWLSPIFGASFLLSAALIYLSVRRQINLLSSGRAAVARAVSSRRTQHGHRVKYEFRLMSGATFQGRLETSGRSLAPDTEFIIIYDPDRPKRATRYPASLVKLL